MIYLHLSVYCRIAKHIGEFESMFLSDLDGGQLHSADAYGGLEGQISDMLCIYILFILKPLLGSRESNAVSVFLSRGTVDESGWRHISCLFEYLSIGLLFLTVEFC